MFNMRSNEIIAMFFHLILIFTGKSAAQTTGGTIPTLPPPTPHSCCRFESDICGLTFTNFGWSAQQSSDSPMPYLSGNYVWTTSEHAGLTSLIQYNVTSYTSFSFAYYNDDCLAQLYFRQAGTGVTNYLGAISSSSDVAWKSYNSFCSDCCDQFPCDGQILLAVDCNGGLLAIDNVGRDNACEEVIPCCTFNSVDMCGFVSTTVDGYSWLYAAQNQPINPPYSTTDYLYFESVNYTGSEALDVILESPPISITSAESFKVNVLVKDSGSATTNNNLLVVFRDSATGGSTQLDYVNSEGGGDMLFDCNSYHGNCCPSGTCVGTIQFIAHLDAFGGKVMTAINSFQIDRSCL